MTNKGGAKQHGYVDVKNRRPKAGLAKKNNKAKAAIRREELRAEGYAC